MFRLVDWVLDKIAPIGLVGERDEVADDWQRPIIAQVTGEYMLRSQIMGHRVSGEDRRAVFGTSPEEVQ